MCRCRRPFRFISNGKHSLPFYFRFTENRLLPEHSYKMPSDVLTNAIFARAFASGLVLWWQVSSVLHKLFHFLHIAGASSVAGHRIAWDNNENDFSGGKVCDSWRFNALIQSSSYPHYYDTDDKLGFIDLNVVSISNAANLIHKECINVQLTKIERTDEAEAERKS